MKWCKAHKAVVLFAVLLIFVFCCSACNSGDVPLSENENRNNMPTEELEKDPLNEGAFSKEEAEFDNDEKEEEKQPHLNATTELSCYDYGIEYNGLHYYIDPSGMLCCLNPDTNSLERIVNVGLSNWVRIVGFTNTNDIYLTDQMNGSVKINLETDELTNLQTASFSGQPRNIVLAGIYNDHLYYWCPDDVDTILYRSNLNENLTEKETLFTAPKMSWRKAYQISGAHVFYSIYDSEERVNNIYIIDLEKTPLESKLYFSFEGGSCSIIDICNEYVLCYTDVTFSNGKLVIYDRERDVLSEKNGIDLMTQYSQAFDPKEKRWYYWNSWDGGVLCFIDITDTSEGTFYRASNGYTNADLDGSFMTKIGDELYFGSGGVQYRISSDGKRFLDLR